MHGILLISPNSAFAADLTGYTTGLLISGLLLILTLRAAKLSGTPLANIGFAICGLLWSAGGLAETIFLVAGMPYSSPHARVSLALRMAGMTMVSIPILSIWRPYAVENWQKKAGRIVHLVACAGAAAVVLLLIAAALLRDPRVPSRVPLGPIGHIGGMLCTLVLLLGAGVSLRSGTTPRAVYVPSVVIVLSGAVGALAITIAQHIYQTSHHLANTLVGLGEHLLLLLIFCTFFLFARFRYADIFIRYSVRIFLAGAFATFMGFAAVQQMPQHVVQRVPFTQTAHALVITLLIYALLLSFSYIDQWSAALVDHVLFHPPNFRAAMQQLSEQLRHLESEEDVTRAVEESVRRTLEVSNAKLTVIDDAATHFPDGEPTELDYVWHVPVASSGRISHVLLITPGAARPGLVTHDINYLRAVATLCGNRLDALRREREALEQRSRETVLLQQVTEAELRALRAQINPHFLFNSLNTIADLVVRDPGRAETMTLRLASVFRHVLAHAARPLTTIHDEMEFLRAYLHIEEVRFGDRLKVQIDETGDVTALEIPSLILQPLVENALKHGLGPKTGPGHLWISARIEGAAVCLRIEDDGMGLQTATEGTGLTNVRERLRTLYGDGASLTLEPREGGGSCATVRIPN